MIYNDILIGEVEISQFDDYGVYMYVYIYMYIYRMTIICYGFSSMNENMMWYHAAMKHMMNTMPLI